MGFDVVGVGIAGLDLIGVAAAEPQLGAKQALAGWVEMGGGPVATALAAVARLGGRAALATAVGDDAYGARIVAGLRAAGVDVSAVQLRPGASHVAFVLAEPGRDRRTVWWHNDPAILAGVALDRALITSARALLIDTHMPEAALAAARWMREAGGLVMIDAERVRPSTLELLPHCDLLVVSERFGREATGMAEPREAALALHGRYGRLALVTGGAAGSWCAHEGELFHTPAFAVEPVDTTGAGDVFHGALLHALLRGDPVPAAVRFASAAAALSCRGLGGRGHLPTPDEVAALAR
ncbi:MAG TPA: PfkB family carbohydrate kinase [Chloroflexaceae bacterium]|nr:PfkB family carbohydrate kinase [Chloroflexaceae bacterium]